MTDLFERASKFFSALQAELCDALAEADGGAAFTTDAWQRPDGGGGVARVLEGGPLFEKAGVSWSNIEGTLPSDWLASDLPGQGRTYRASGVSVVLHPRSPMVPTTHANFRCVVRGDALWFGGGMGLSPCYLFADDAVLFHRTIADVCERHAPIADYDRLKARCDTYSFLPHRNETLGVGGCQFDDLGASSPTEREAAFDFVCDLARSFTRAYLPIAQRRQPLPYGEAERTWQLRRRGRFVEFSLLLDRVTRFGLGTNGRTESILLPLPPLVRWDYDVMAQPGSPEAELLTHLRPIDWLGRAT